MEREQIIKALECCTVNDWNSTKCNECPFYNGGGGCIDELKNSTIALINSQEQRIGAQDMTISELRKRVEKAEHDADRYAQKIKELTEERNKVSEKGAEILGRLEESFLKLEGENIRLTEENERLRAEKEAKNKELFYKWKKLADETADRFEGLYQDAKKALVADTVRKMQERLCEGRVSNDTVVIVANQIANELIGETK